MRIRTLITQSQRDTVRLLRIPFSAFLMPVYLLALSQAHRVDPFAALAGFLIIHLLVYPSSNGYNSYVDRDESSIGGLEHPPLPTRQLFATTVVLDLTAIALGAWLVNPYFAALVAIYILASRAYSHPVVRLKRHPWAGFLTVTFFQGGFTFYLSYTGITNGVPVVDQWFVLLMAASSLQIAGAYPLTQIYQHDEDLRRGDISLSARLGHKGTFLFSGVMFVLATACYAWYFQGRNAFHGFIVIQVLFLPAVAYFLKWTRDVYIDPVNATFRQAMRMNALASVCLSAAFLVLFLLNRVS